MKGAKGGVKGSEGREGFYSTPSVFQVWHGQWIYWTPVIASIYNLVLIAFERYVILGKSVYEVEITGSNFTLELYQNKAAKP